MNGALMMWVLGHEKWIVFLRVEKLQKSQDKKKKNNMIQLRVEVTIFHHTPQCQKRSLNHITQLEY